LRKFISFHGIWNKFLWREFTPFIIEEKIGALIVERIRCILWKLAHLVVENIWSISSLRKFLVDLMFESSVEAVLLLL
jgi:hypothetical protein